MPRLAHLYAMAHAWYGDQSSAESWSFGALAVIWPLLERMGVAEIINRHLPADPQAEYDHGTVLSLLAAARLYHPVALVNVARWAEDSGADISWNLPVERITDDRLGKRASYLSIEQQRRRVQGNLPHEHYDLAVVRHTLVERESGAEIPCRGDLRVQHSGSQGRAKEP